MRKIKNLRRHLAAMKKACLVADRLLMNRYGRLKSMDIHEKSLNDFVTIVDRESQRRIVRVLKRAFPYYGVQAEEDDAHIPEDWMWVIDPLDGTSNYIHQFPMFCISIALVYQGKPQIGMIHDPVHKECFSAVNKKGAYMNGKRIHVSKTRQLRRGFLGTGFPFRERKFFAAYHESFSRMFHASSGMRRGGSAALDLAYVACGRLDGFWELGLKPWDVAAGELIVKEAGGALTDFMGKRHQLNSGHVVAANPYLQPSMIRILRQVKRFHRLLI